MELSIAEIPYENGSVRFQYSRYPNEAGDRWVKHGPFFAYHENGAIASKGNYVHGVEQGEWEDYHPDGQLAARGFYEQSEKIGTWRYWRANGTEEI